VSEEGLTKNSTKETQHQTPLEPNLGALRNFVLCFSQTPALGPTLHTLYG